MLSREDAIKKIVERHTINSIYIVSTGYISRSFYSLYPDYSAFYMKGSMGLAPGIGLGLALFCKKDIVVISGDGALLMHLGLTHTIRDASLSNLYVYVLDNGCYESVGGTICSSLEYSYPGITDIIKISKGSKPETRVGINFMDNFDRIRKVVE